MHNPHNNRTGATAMLGHLVYSHTNYWSGSRSFAPMGWLRRVLSALFRRH